MQNDLAHVIDMLYTTHSDVERRSVMAKLTAFFATPESWSALLALFTIALSAPSANVSEQKRRQRICFFAGNALLTKIKRDALQISEIRLLITSIHGLMLATDPTNGQIFARDPTTELLGKATIKRLVLCLATLASKDAQLVAEYIDYAVSLSAPPQPNGSSREVQQLGLEMLLAVANPTSEEEDGEDVYPIVDKLNLREAVPKVVSALEVFIKRTNSMTKSNGESSLGAGFKEMDPTLALETLRAYLVILQTPAVFRRNWPDLFAFVLSSMSIESGVEAIRASAAIFRSLADFCKLTDDQVTKDALIEGVIRARPRYQQLIKDEDACHAIAGAFARVAECDVNRIAKGQCPRFGEMIDFALEILAHPQRSAVGRNALDFFLCVQDVPLAERTPGLNEFFFLRLLGTLVLSCQVTPSLIPETPEDEEGADDVLLFRSSSDGPRDLFASVYGILSERYVQELVAIVANPEFDFLRAESALFALRCASKEICQMISKRDASKQHQRLALFDLFDRFLRISFRGDMYFRSSMCATIADFSPVLHLLGMDKTASSSSKPVLSSSQLSEQTVVGTLSTNMEYVLKNLEDPAADLLLIQRACATFQRLCSRHSKVLSPYVEEIFYRITSKCHPFTSTSSVKGIGGMGEKKAITLMLENRKATAEGLSRLVGTQGADETGIHKANKLMESLLKRVTSSNADALELATLASFVKYLPPSNIKVVEMTFLHVGPLLEACFGGLVPISTAAKSLLHDEQLESFSELLSAFFFCCASKIDEPTLSAILAWVVHAFHDRPTPCLANNAGKAVELFANSVLTDKQCAGLVRSLLSQPGRLLNEFSDSVPAVLDMVRRVFLFMPESLFAPSCMSNPDDPVTLCEFIIKCVVADEREIAREACVLLADMINRTRMSNSGTGGQESRWSIFQTALDQILSLPRSSIAGLAELLAQSLMKGDSRILVAENVADLLYAIVRAYPVTIQSWNGAMEQCARSSTKEGFRRFVMERIPSHSGGGMVGVGVPA